MSLCGLYLLLALHSATTLTDGGGLRTSPTELTKGSCVYLLFIHQTCPHSWVATPYFDQLSHAYGSITPVVGVINADQPGYFTWQERFHVRYRVLLDPKSTWMKSFKATSSPWVVKIGHGGKVLNSWGGLSVGILQSLNADMAATAHRPLVRMNTEGAPTIRQYGCIFD